MPRANLGEYLVIVLLVIEVQRTSANEWLNSGTITLSPLNGQIFSKEKNSYWVHNGERVEHRASQESFRGGSSSKSTNVLESIVASTTTPSSSSFPPTHTSLSSSSSSSSASISQKQTLNTFVVPISSTVPTTVLDHTLTVAKATDRKGGAGDAEAKGPIISSLASVLAISYWQNQRKKCCLNRLCPCRQYPYIPNGSPAGGAGGGIGSTGVGMMPGMGPFPGGPFGGQAGFYPGGGMPGMGFPGQTRPGGFRPGGGGSGGGGGEEEEELEHGFQGPFEVHTRPPKRRRPSALKPTVILRPVSISSGTGQGPHYPMNGIKWSAVDSSGPSSMSSSELSHEITGTSGLFSLDGEALYSHPLVRQTKVNSRTTGTDDDDDTIKVDTSTSNERLKEEEKEETKKIVRAKRKSPQFPWMRLDFKDSLKDARISDTSQLAQARTSLDKSFAWKETTQEEITVRDQVKSAKGIKDLVDISPVESLHLLLREKRAPTSAGIVSPVMSLPTRPNAPSIASIGRINRRNPRKSSTNSDSGQSGQGNNGNLPSNSANSNIPGGNGKKIRKNSRLHETSTMTHTPRVHRSRNSHRERKG